MTTLIRFTLIHGIELILFGFLLAVLSIYICYIIGEKQVQREYNDKYKNLEWDIEYLPVNEPNKETIKRLFDEISKFPCKNYEKLQVLEQNFYKKFGK